MADYLYQPIDPFTGRPNQDPGQVPDFYSNMPRLQMQDRPSAIGGGLAAGFQELQGLGGAAVGALGRAVGLDPVAQWGEDTYRSNMEEAAQVGRPDLDVAPWREDGAPVLSWLGYQAARQVPQLAAALGVSLIPGAQGVGASLGLARLGAMAPGILGGAGLRAGASFAARRAAAETGKRFAAGAIGGAAVGLPMGAGSMYGEAIDRGDPTQADAVKALGLSPLYAASEMFELPQLRKFAEAATEGGIKSAAKTAAKGALAAAAVEMPTEAFQTAMELSFRPDMSSSEKARAIVDAAITGGAVGGVFGGVAGGVGGLRTARQKPASGVTNEDIEQTVDQTLQLAPEGPAVTMAEGPGDTVGAPARQLVPQGAGFEQRTRETPFQEIETEALVDALGRVEERMVAGQASQQEGVLRERIRNELARREAEQPAQPQAVPEQPMIPEVERFVGLQNTRAKAKELARVGGKQSFIDRLDATNDVELFEAVQKRMEDGKSDAPTMKLARELGIIDEKDQPTDLDRQIEAQSAKVEQAARRVRDTGEGQKQLEKQMQALQQLRAKKPLYDQVKAARAQRTEQDRLVTERLGLANDRPALPSPDQFPASFPSTQLELDPAETGVRPITERNVSRETPPQPDPAQTDLFDYTPPLSALEQQARRTAAQSPQLGPLAEPLARGLASGVREQDFAAAERAASRQLQDRQFREAEQALIEQEEAGQVPEPVRVLGSDRTVQNGRVVYNVRLSNNETVPVSIKAVGKDRGAYVGGERVGANLQEAALNLARRAQERIRYSAPSERQPANDNTVVIDLKARRDQKQLENFHQNFMAGVGERAREMAERTLAAVEAGVFGDIEVNERIRTPKGQIWTVKGMVLRKMSPRDETNRNRIAAERGADAPLTVEIEGVRYNPILSVEYDEDGSTTTTDADYGLMQALGGYVTMRGPIRYSAPSMRRQAEVLADRTGRRGTERGQNFANFFRESAVTDRRGRPQVVYHFTNQEDGDFTVFRMWQHFGSAKAARDRARHLLPELYSPDGSFVGRGAGEGATYPVFLSIQNPMELKDLMINSPQTYLRAAVDAGHIPQQEYDDFQAWYQPLYMSTGRVQDQQALKARADELIADIFNKYGYDGIKYINEAEDVGSVSWVALRPEQIKSAIGNDGSFSSNPDIRRFEAPAYNPYDPPRNPPTVQQAQEDIAKITAGWKNNVPVTVVQTPEDLSDSLYGELFRDGKLNAYGFVSGAGQAYIIAGNLPSRDMVPAVLYHEVLGHKGLSAAFGDDLDNVLRDLLSNPKFDAEVKAWMQAYPRSYGGSKIRAAEEILARWSEQGRVTASMWQKFVALIRKYARQMGLIYDFSDNDIRVILAMAHDKAIGTVKFQKGRGGNRYMYVGEQAVKNLAVSDVDEAIFKTAMLDIAVKRLERGHDPNDIRLYTGWFQGLDGKWRWEIPDRDSSLTSQYESLKVGDEMALDQALDHPRLFQLYPDLRNVRVKKYPSAFENGSYLDGLIRLNPDNDLPMQHGVMLHEIMHWIQEKEGFALGANPLSVLSKLTNTQLERIRDEVTPELSNRLQKEDRKANLYERTHTIPNFGNVWRAHHEYKVLTGQQSAMRKAPGYDPVSPSTVAMSKKVQQAFNEMKAMRRTVMAHVFAGATDEMQLDSTEKELLNSLATIMKDATSPGEAKSVFRKNQTAMRKQADTTRKTLTDATTTPDGLINLAKAAGKAPVYYQAAAGEIEARNVVLRSTYSDENLRAQKPIQETLDTDLALKDYGFEDIVYIYDAATPASPIPSQNESMVRYMSGAQQTLDRVSQEQAERVANGQTPLQLRASSIRGRFRPTALYWSTLENIVSSFTRVFPQYKNGLTALEMYARAHRLRTNIEARLSQMAMRPHKNYEALSGELQTKVGKLMEFTQFDIDPAVPWSGHAHLYGTPNEAKLRSLVAEANQIYRSLKQSKDKAAIGVYEDFRAVNDAIYYAQQTMGLWNYIYTLPQAAQIPMAKTNPMEKFVGTSSLHDSPTEARKYWREQVDTLVRQTEDVLRTQYGDNKAKDQVASRLREYVDNIKRQQREMERAPYFHLGRFGDYFVAFNVTPLKDQKIPDVRHLRTIQKELDKLGFRGITLTEGTQRNNVYIRVENQTQADQLFEAMKRLQKTGAVDPSVEPQKGKRTDSGDVLHGQHQLVTQLLSAIENSTAYQVLDEEKGTPIGEAKMKAKQRAQQAVRDALINLAPDTSIRRIMVHRDNVPGFDKNMVRSYTFGSQVGAHALANMAASSVFTDSFTGMKAAIEDAKREGGDKVYKQQDVMQELMLRESERPRLTGRNFIDNARAFNHVYFLGLSPAYFALNVTQLGVLLWPELAKKGGFVNAAKVVAKVTPTAFKIAGHLAKIAAKQGWKHIADAPVNAEALRAAGLSEKDIEFAMAVINRGVVDIGSASRELGRVVDDKQGDWWDTFLRMGSALGYYSEVLARMTAALSAREVMQQTEPGASFEKTVDYATSVVDQSMLNYSAYNIARATGKSGFAGQMTPLIMSFMQYQLQVMEKLYRETYDMFKGESPAERAEARKFMLAHATALTVFAGTLGLPLASVAARVVEILVDSVDDDDEPYDAKAAWRNFLASIFGNDIAEVLARGVPRAAGFDISQRAGEADIIPGTRLLVDKRDWNEAAKDFATNTLGSPFSMATNFLQGMSEVGQGEVLKGMTTMMPKAISDGFKAYSLTEKGYVDTSGNPMPMTPGSLSILYQAMGFSPAERAEYQEARTIQTVRKGELIRNASVIRRNLASSLEQGDMESAREWYRKAQRFDQNNPAFAILPRIEQVIRQRARSRAYAEGTGTPLGISPRDTRAPALTGFANYQ